MIWVLSFPSFFLFLLCLALIYTSVLQLWVGNSTSVPSENFTGSRTLAHFNGQCNNLCTGGLPLEALLCTEASEAPLSITMQSLHYSFTSHPFIIYWAPSEKHGGRCYNVLIKDAPLCQNIIFCYRSADIIVWFDNRSTKQAQGPSATRPPAYKNSESSGPNKCLNLRQQAVL